MSRIQIIASISTRLRDYLRQGHAIIPQIIFKRNLTPTTLKDKKTKDSKDLQFLHAVKSLQQLHQFTPIKTKCQLQAPAVVRAAKAASVPPKPSAHAARSLLSNAAVTRPVPRTKLQDPAAHAAPVLLDLAHVIALRLRILLQVVPSAPVVLDLLMPVHVRRLLTAVSFPPKQTSQPPTRYTTDSALSTYSNVPNSTWNVERGIMSTHTATDFLAAFGGLFTFFFTPPCISLDTLRYENWRVHYTVPNIVFGLFWGTAFFIARQNGVWPRFWEHLLVDVHTFRDCALWTRDRMWWIIAAVVVVASVAGIKYIYAIRLEKVKRIRKIVARTSFYIRSAYQIKAVAYLIGMIPVFTQQLIVNYFLWRTRDEDGEIMIIETPEEKPEKPEKVKLGVPKSIRIQQMQAIEAAQALVVQESNGSIGKVSGPMKKK